ncbi:hypothetical protein ACIQTZ_01460 [Paenarthrobacter sp. NPDC090520]|uniref:hypothetical protein n=1 Tax=unclassified Paenarthrobacter TaxID=2634190 RepID=UPI00380C14E0
MEFILLGLLLMVPLIYFVVTIGQIQGGMFAVVGAADQAAKAYVQQAEPGAARAAAEQAALVAAKDYGFLPDAVALDVSCDRHDCLSAGAAVTVSIQVTVPLPMAPFGDALHLDAARLHASATQKVGRFR